MTIVAVFRKSIVAASWVALLAATALSQAPPQASRTLDPGFQERAITHVRQLAALGERVAGGKGESKAAVYVKEQMEKAGLGVVVEPFEFQSFVLESAVLTAGTDHAEILRLGFNPYAGGDRRIGELAFVESTGNMGAVLKLELDDKIVVTTESGNFYVLSMFKRPRAIVSLSRPEFQRLQAAGVVSGEIAFRGRVVKTRSANIVGSLASESGAGQEIILSAHYDSWKGPGANDNASGVAVLLELARHFRSLKTPPAVPMRFVAFGAEELGLMGAKAYLEKHQAELQDCRLLFNMDTVGGNGDIFVNTRPWGPGMPAQVESRLLKEPIDKATSDIEHRWMLVGLGPSPMLANSTVPEWLRTAVSETSKELGLEIRSSSGMGSDHRVFFQAGVVATDIAISGPGLHTPADVLESVSARSLETAAQVVTMVVEKTMHSGK